MKRKRLVVTALILVILAITATTVYSLSRKKWIVTSGTVEALNIHVGSKVGGRIEKIFVREGDFVSAGQVLVTFEDQEVTAALESARAAVAEAQANYDKMQRGSRPEDKAEARANAEQAKASLRAAENGYRHEEVAQVNADLDRARARAQNAELQYRRASELAKEGVFSRQQLDDATENRDAALANLRNAEHRSAEFEKGYRDEDVAAAKAKFAEAEAVRVRVERGYRSEEIAAALAQLNRAKASLRDAETRYREREVIAPSNATVEVLDVRPGDLIAPNAPIALLLERGETYVRVYVPETEFGLVRLGQSAELRVDAFPKKPFHATVEQINQQAEFLPRNVQTREERAHQVVGIKLRIDDPAGLIRAGMSADVRMRMEGE